MKLRKWAAIPYAPVRTPERGTNPYVCRIAPNKTGFQIEWIDPSSEGPHTLACRKRAEQGEYMRFPLPGAFFDVSGLLPETDYEFFVERDSDGARSELRLVYTYEPVGTVINYIHPEDTTYDYTGGVYGGKHYGGRYLGSPSVMKLPDGSLLAGCDIGWWDNQGQGQLFRSEDGGKTWRLLSEMYPFAWTRYFTVKDKLYATGGAGEGGDLIIAESSDWGRTWTEPVVLRRSAHGDDRLRGNSHHQGNTPILRHNGRIYMGIECGSWRITNGNAYGIMLISAAEDSDLLSMDSWEYTPPAYVPQNKIDIPFTKYVTGIEGTPVVAPDGQIYNFIRLDPDPHGPTRTVPVNKAAAFRFVDFDTPLEFVSTVDAEVALRDMFYILYDEKTKMYFMVANGEDEKNVARRTRFVLNASADLFHWRKLATLLDVTDLPNEPEENAIHHGISQPGVCIDGDDLLFTSRTACGKSKNQHDTNMFTFHRVPNFRNYLDSGRTQIEAKRPG